VTRSLRRATAAAITGGALVLGGCGGVGGADVAARVNGHVISEDAARTTAQQINAAFDLQEPLTTGQAATWLVKAPFILDVANAKGQPVTDATARQSLAKVDPSADTVEVVKANFALYQMQQSDPALIDTVIADLQRAKITVNPRYGRFDPTSLEMVPMTPNWIAGQS
jgi:hypothetical protein